MGGARILVMLLLFTLGGCSAILKQAAQQSNPPTPARTYTPPPMPKFKEPPVYRRPGDPLPPPPPDPANTTAFVPPMTNFSGTPAALGAPDLQRIIEDRYEDLDYAFLTRKSKEMAAFYDDTVLDNGKKVSRAQEEQSWQEAFEEFNEIERKYEVSLRVGSKSEILKLTPKGADQVAVQFRMTQRGFARVGGDDLQFVWIYTGRDLWVKKGDTWVVRETSSSDPEEHTYVNGVQTK